MDLPIEYIPGNDVEYVLFIKSLEGKAKLTGINGLFRWVVTREDGSQYIARPESAKLHEANP